MKREVRKKVEIGTLRIKSRDLKVYEKTSNGWKISKREFPNALEVVKLFKVHGKFDVLRDTKKPEFLKGQVSKARMVQGARINILPDGKVLNKAYSLFAEDLTIHDEKSNNHWDVLYKHPNDYLISHHESSNLPQKENKLYSKPCHQEEYLFSLPEPFLLCSLVL